jgi:hypothetical protein
MYWLRASAFFASFAITFGTPPRPSPDWHSAAAFLAGGLLMWAVTPRKKIEI